MSHTPRTLENQAYFAPVPRERTRLMRFSLALVAFALLLGGCGHMRPVRYYEISYPAVGPAKQEPLNATLLVRAFATSHLYREDRIVYGSGSDQMGTYQNERWSEPPAEMLQNALVRELRSTGRFRTVTVLRSDSSGDFVLTGHLYDFKEVSGNGIVARISFDAELRDLKPGKPSGRTPIIMTSPATAKMSPLSLLPWTGMFDAAFRKWKQASSRLWWPIHEVRAACFSRSDRGLLRPWDASSSVVLPGVHILFKYRR